MRKKMSKNKKNIARGKLHILDVIYFSVDFDSKGGIHAE